MVNIKADRVGAVVGVGPVGVAVGVWVGVFVAVGVGVRDGNVGLAVGDSSARGVLDGSGVVEGNGVTGVNVG